MLRGEAISAFTSLAPADSPKIVTFAGLPPNLADIVPHPVQSHDLIGETIVSGGMVGRLFGQSGMREEAEDAEPVIDIHHHHAVAGEDFTVEQGFDSRSGSVSSTVDPYHDGEGRCQGPFRRPHVQLQAVFAVGQLLVVILIAHRPKGGCIPDTGPGFRRKRLPPAQLADGRLSKRDVLENRHPIGSQAAAKLAGADRNDRIGSRSLCRRLRADPWYQGLPEAQDTSQSA